MIKIIRTYNWKFDYNMLKNDLVAFKDAHGLTWSEIDELAGIGRGNASNVVNGTENNKMNTILALTNVMDIDIRTYFVLEV